MNLKLETSVHKPERKYQQKPFFKFSIMYIHQLSTSIKWERNLGTLALGMILRTYLLQKQKIFQNKKWLKTRKVRENIFLVAEDMFLSFYPFLGKDILFGKYKSSSQLILTTCVSKWKIIHAHISFWAFATRMSHKSCSKMVVDVMPSSPRNLILFFGKYAKGFPSI